MSPEGRGWNTFAVGFVAGAFVGLVLLAVVIFGALIPCRERTRGLTESSSPQPSQTN